MLDGILKWLGPWLLQRLAKILDPEAAAKASKLLQRSNDLNALEIALKVREDEFAARQAKSEKIVADLARQTVELDDRIAELNKKLAADTAVRRGLQDDLKKTLDDINAEPVIDRTALPLPGTGNKGS